MKRNLPFAIEAAIAFILCGFQFANAQNVAPFWSLSGNSNVNGASKIGSTNAFSLRLITSDVERMRITPTGNVGIGTNAPLQKLHVVGNIDISDGSGLYIGNKRLLSTPGSQNLYLGYLAGQNNTGTDNMFIGNSAGQNGNGFHNTMIGFQAGMKNTGANNTFCGYNSGLSNTSGTYNTFFGLATGQNNTTGDGNSFFGQNVLWSNTSGSWNCAFGFETGNLNKTGNYNTYFGTKAARQSSSGNENTFIGASSGYSNAASFNTGVGTNSLYNNNSGKNNAALGYNAGFSNTTGFENNFIGFASGYSNTTGNRNVFIGANAGYSNTTGEDNIFIGGTSGYKHTSSNYNVSIGEASAYGLTTGIRNCYYGQSAGHDNATGSLNMNFGAFCNYLSTNAHNNSCFGANAGDFAHNGNNNTFIGSSAVAATDGLTNATALGYNAFVYASNQVRLGSAAVTSIGGFADWTNISDGRLKENIKDNVPGLEFINQLKAVTYNLKLADITDKIKNRSLTHDGTVAPIAEDAVAAMKEKERTVYTGFVAQDVEKAAKKLGFDFSGVDAPKNDKDYYGLRYAQFVVPLVKSVQELSQKNDDLQNQVDELRLIVELMRKEKGSGGNIALSSASIDQNTPNPFNRSTEIRYHLPSAYKAAKVVITDNLGHILKTINVSKTQSGVFTIQAGNLAAGVYNYTLFVDNIVVDTKKMVLTK